MAQNRQAGSRGVFAAAVSPCPTPEKSNSHKFVWCHKVKVYETMVSVVSRCPRITTAGK